ncbi:hypothetical protein JK211_14430 [Tatumella sp. JGM130]|uniref:ankyrin repeat domain-containing protein n=1 Tax=Tatumella sp. JGM130 TaxID=2799797 RepID=UPI001BAE7CB8|nr:ankyrin repeat domain-containing protein [Tatumella sp. JGM130]MBS0895211.1 hypothetical protein [Tatumella sp. JGM130]
MSNIKVKDGIEDEMKKYGFYFENDQQRKEVNLYLDGRIKLKNCDNIQTALVEIFFKNRETKEDYMTVDKRASIILKQNNFDLNDNVSNELHNKISLKPQYYISILHSIFKLDINKFCYLKNSEIVDLKNDNVVINNYSDQYYNNRYNDNSKTHIMNSIDIKLKDNNGNTCLFYPCSKNKVMRAIKAGVEINAVNDNGINALFNSDFETSKILIANFINVHKKDNLGRTALFYAGNDFDKAKILIDNGLSVNTVDHLGRTPLFYAENKKVLDLYLKNGAKKDILDNNGDNAFEFIADKMNNDKNSNYNKLGVEFLLMLEKEKLESLVNNEEGLEEKKSRKMRL